MKSSDHRTAPGARALLTGFGLLVIAVAAAVSFGAESVSLARVVSEPESLDRTIVLSARLPRVLLGVVSGGGLAAVGVAFQTLLRNPLAEPFILGVSGGAAFGATLAILFGLTALSVLGASLIPLAALAGGLTATAMVYAVARRSQAPSATSILLAGVVVNAIASAAITFLKTLVSAAKAQELLFWLIGFLDVPSPTALVSLAVYVGIGATILLVDAGRLNLLALGDDPARHLGVDVRALERRTFFACSLVVGGIVSITGLIGFIGLMVPHALRRLFGPDVRVILPASLLAGGGTLVLCDLVSRVLFRFLHTEPPVGAVTALIGGPLFLLLLGKRLQT
ncbi:FecCD family ABC transporter permease [Pendulispora albinea]|uniref:Iron ABC transporter permease n=1 Tax=Pendulispora albinea TaxID=2741071 RepID=A0ABZ2LU58_9BACT